MELLLPLHEIKALTEAPPRNEKVCYRLVGSRELPVGWESVRAKQARLPALGRPPLEFF
jgi:hypothetical protein